MGTQRPCKLVEMTGVCVTLNPRQNLWEISWPEGRNLPNSSITLCWTFLTLLHTCTSWVPKGDQGSSLKSSGRIGGLRGALGCPLNPFRSQTCGFSVNRASVFFGGGGNAVCYSTEMIKRGAKGSCKGKYLL